MSRYLALTLWALGLLCWAGMLVFLPAVNAYLYPQIEAASLLSPDALGTLALWGLSAVGLVVVWRAANHRYGWLMLVTGFAFTLTGFTENYSFFALVVAPEADLPFALLAAWLQNLWIINLGLLFVYMPLLFPDGLLPAPRWRPVMWFITLFLAFTALGFAFLDAPLTNIFLEIDTPVPNPLGFLPTGFIPQPLVEGIIGFFALVFFACMLAAIGSLVFRWRGASREVRQQIRWLVYVLGVLVAARAAEWILFTIFISLLGNLEEVLLPYFRYAQVFALIGLEAALGFAVLKYRLYDIDLIINRTLVYGSLTLIIVAGYVLLVSGLSILLPGELGLAPSLLATAVVAVLFAPLKDRLQRTANRLVFGDRERPYEVLRTLGMHLETPGGTENVLPAIAETLAKSLKYPFVSITLLQDENNEMEAEYGSQRGESVDLPLYYQAHEIGYLSVCLRSGEYELATGDRDLLHQIALWLGPVAHASQLTRELRQSNASLVSARAEERRRLYRDLHDGLGPTLASQTFRFDQALEMLTVDPETAAQILQELKAQTQGLVLEIRRLVYALRSSTLDELGLVGSLREAVEGFRGSSNGLQITLEADEQDLAGLPAAHEQAAERIALEALTNVVRHSNAYHCRLVLRVQPGTPRQLVMKIEDDGRGLPEHYSPGVGIFSMIQRAEALEGSVRFEPNHPNGTRVVARLPFSHPVLP